MPLFTIGHSNHNIGKFFELVSRHEITHIIDVRSVPYSGRFPHFNRTEFADACRGKGIEYVWRGDLLGGNAVATNNLNDFESRDSFRKAIETLALEIITHETRTVCLMCAERDPSNCHRATLIGKELRGLAEHALDLHHILSDGTLTLQSDLELARKITGLDRSGTLNLFEQ